MYSELNHVSIDDTEKLACYEKQTLIYKMIFSEFSKLYISVKKQRNVKKVKFICM